MPGEIQDTSGPCPRDPIPRGPSLGPSTFWSTLETWCLLVTCSGVLASSETCLPIPVHLRVRASLKPLTCNKPCLMPAPGSQPPGEGLSQGPVFPVEPGSLLSLVAPPSVPVLPGSCPSWGLTLLNDRTQSLTSLGVPVLLGDLYWFWTLLSDPPQGGTLLSDLPHGPALSGPRLVSTGVRASPVASPRVRYSLVPPR